MTEILLQKLGISPSTAQANLSTAQAHLRELASRRKQLRVRQELTADGDVCSEACFVLEGIACRYRQLSGGRRAILAFLLPGDFCGLDPQLTATMDHAVAALTPCTIASASRASLQEALRLHPAIAAHLAAALQVESAIHRRWLANMANPSDKRLAHLMCEFRARLAQVGQADERGFFLPLTQHDLGEALGISTVHMNRTLQHLKDLGLMRMMERRVTIANLSELESFAEFDSAYLGTAGRGTPT